MPHPFRTASQATEWRRGLPLLALGGLLFAWGRLYPGQVVELSMTHYLPLHTWLETLSIVMAALACALLWRVPASQQRTSTEVLAACLAASAVLDFLHVQSYAGMPPMVTPAGPEKAIAFWLASRAMLALGVAAMAWGPGETRAQPGTRWTMLLLSALLCLGVSWMVLYRPDSLPRTFVPGQGLTAAKVWAEVLLVAVLVAAALRVRSLPSWRELPASSVLALAALFAALAELCVASYGTVSDTLNLLGHLCKIAAGVHMSRAAFLLAVRQPMQELGDLAVAFRTTLNPALICDPQGNISWVNQAMLDLSGYTASDLLGRSVSLLSADPSECARHGTLAAILSGQSWQGQVQIRRRDGTLCVDDRTLTPMRDAQGFLVGYVVVGGDVTERARAAQEAADSAERMRVLMASAPDAVVVIDQRGIIQLANPQVDRLFGFGAGELVGSNVSVLMPPHTAAAHDGYVNHYTSTRERNIIGTGRDVVARRKDGSPLHVHLTVGEARLREGTVFIGFMRDISERMQTQQALADREARYRTLMDTAMDGVWITNTRGHLIAVNEAYIRLSGYSREELLGMQIPDLEAQENASDVAAHIQRVQATGSDKFESVHRAKDGRLWPVELSVTWWNKGDGHLFVFARDLTEQKAAARALRESEQRFALALRGSNDGLWDHDLVANTLYLAPRCKEMLGYRDDELANSPATLTMLLHPDDSLRYHLTMGDVASGEGGERYEIEMRLSHKQGHWVDVLARGQLVRDETGRPVRLIGTHQDLSERKRAERAMLENEQKLRRLFKLSPLGIVLTTMDGTLVEFNEAYRAMTGYSAEALHKMTFWDLTPPEHLLADGEQLAIIARTGRFGPFEKEYLRLDGSRVPVRLNGAHLEIHGKPHTWTMVEDLTTTRRVEAERQALQKQQMQSQKLEALGHLTGGVAHDFNNMLAGIMGLASLGLERYVSDRDSKLGQYLKEIVRTSERGRDLVAKMLAYARTEEQAAADPRDVVPLVRELRDMLATSIPSGVRLTCEIRQPLPQVRISPVDVHQIVMNLVINARDAVGEHGKIAIELRTELMQGETCISCGEGAVGPHLVLEVRDDGCGIPDSVLSKIFDPFFTTKDIGKGTGLGLSSVLGVVHKAGGHMQVQTRQGRGTTMRVMLPAADAAQHTEPAVGAPALPRASSHACVWVVDDDPAVLVFLTELLSEQGFEVRAYSDPKVAAKALRQGESLPVALITDQTMPGMSGVELASRVMRAYPAIGVVLCTGFSEHVDEATAKAMGIRHFLRKPFDSRLLLDALVDVTRDTA